MTQSRTWHSPQLSLIVCKCLPLWFNYTTIPNYVPMEFEENKGKDIRTCSCLEYQQVRKLAMISYMYFQ